MSQIHKVLWGEGLFLRPQHFQRQDLYHEQRLHETANTLHPFAWGVSRVAIDKDALANNVLRLLELACVFQDGEIYSAPEREDLPEAIDLGNFPLSQQTITYYTALPSMKGFGANLSTAEKTNASARYSQANVDTSDLFTQAASADISYLKKSVRLLSELDQRDSYTCFPLLRLRRTSTAGFELDTSFMPPGVSIQSIPILATRLRRLMDALQAKVNALYGHHREPSKNVVEFRSGDISSFMLLHTASSGYATLTHYFHNPQLHPERLHEQLLTLAGSLMTFSKNHSLADLPAYQHGNPGPGFEKLDEIIRSMLDTVISSRYFAINLSEVRPGYQQGMLDSGKINDKTTFYLAVAANMPAVELIDVVPLRLKIGAPEDVDKFVLAALPGVKLVHTPQVPSAVPVRPDTYYFTLENRGAMYERMLQAQSISIYVPSGISDLKLELLAVNA